MRVKILILIFSCLCYQISADAEAHDRPLYLRDSLIQAERQLKFENARTDLIPNTIKPYQIPKCDKPLVLKENQIGLRRKDSENCVAIMETTGKKAFLNPKGYYYAYIPQNTKMTQDEAIILWGTDTKPLKAKKITFQLYEIKKYPEQSVLLDCLFNNSSLTRYRFRTKNKNFDWVSLTSN